MSSVIKSDKSGSNRPAEEARRRAAAVRNEAAERKRAADAGKLSKTLKAALSQIKKPEAVAKVLVEIDRLSPEAKALFKKSYATLPGSSPSADYRAEIATQFSSGSAERGALEDAYASALGYDPGRVSNRQLRDVLDQALAPARPLPLRFLTDGFTPFA